MFRFLSILAVLTITTPVCAQTSGSTSGATSSVDIVNPTNPNSTNHLITTPTVVAPGLAAAGIETCLGSASGGLSVMGGGLTFGSTTVDAGCTIRLLSRQLFAFGYQKAALALMCQDQRVAAAMNAAGSACPATAEVRMSDSGSFAPVNGFAEEEEQSRPVTQDVQAWFDRASDMH